jgi:hypothetical protein
LDSATQIPNDETSLCFSHGAAVLNHMIDAN